MGSGNPLTAQQFLGFSLGLLIVSVGLAQNNAAIVIVGAVVALVGLAIERLKDLSAGGEKGIRASFRKVADAVEEQLPAPEPGKPQEASTQPKEVTIELGGEMKPTGELTTTYVPGGGNARAMIVKPEDIAAAKDERELVQRVIGYVQQAQGPEPARLPGLRGLSKDRVRFEQDLFGAILDLQTDRSRSGDLGTDNAFERAVQEEIVRWWNNPEQLSDEEVVDLAGRVRSLTAMRYQRPR